MHTPPAIAQEWVGQGGTYVGLSRGCDGEPDYHLIVGPELSPANWVGAKQQAAALEIDGHADFTLPTRREQALLFANVPELFKKDWYWSGEQHASFSGYAWVQVFGDGVQDGCLKGDEGRARAVRRLKIS